MALYTVLDCVQGDGLAYPLQSGYVGNWLVAGPVATPIGPELPRWNEDPGIAGAAVERGPIGTGIFEADGHNGVWAYHACPLDHYVDHSGFYRQRAYLRSWAYAELVCDAAQEITLELAAYGPAGVWVNGVPRFHLDQSKGHFRLGQTTGQFRIDLQERATAILVRFEHVAIGATPHAMALRVLGRGVSVRIPTLIVGLGRRTAFEQLTAGVYVDRDVYAGDTPIMLHWPEGDNRAFCPAHVRLQGDDGSIYALADVAGQPGDALDLGFAMRLPAGPLHVTLMPSPNEVYLDNTRIFHQVPLWSMGRQRYHAAPSGDLAARRSEALLAAAQRADSPIGQIARMALGGWDEVTPAILVRATEAVDDLDLVVLLGMLCRFGDDERFPDEVRRSVEDAVLGHAYVDSGLLTYAAEILAGQRYPERTFADGRAGAWHRVRGKRMALDWMTSFGCQGSADLGSPEAIERQLVALSHLADLATDTQVYELAAVCTDKLLFTLAVHSRRGVLGAACRNVLPGFLKSGYLQATAGISRMLWGTGMYNHHVVGTLSLACASGYEPPPILESVAHDDAAELWSRERHAPAQAEPTAVVTYKTPDYILSSLRNLAAGVPGSCELMWRVTLGPEAVVFANHPGSSSESDSRVPGYWAGNARLPRIGHWMDALVAMYRLDPEDVFGFTHAYFPCAAFDEYVLRDGWAFARVADGYLGLTNSAGMALTREGRYAMRELRAMGRAQSWLVQMGRVALDGDFNAFQAKVLAMPPRFTEETVHYTTLRGGTLTLSWRGALSVNGEAQSADARKHIDNRYTSTDLGAAAMGIRHGDDYLRLDFAIT